MRVKFLALSLASLLVAAACGGAKTHSSIATGTPELEQPKFGYDANKALGTGGKTGGTSAGTRPTAQPAGGGTTTGGSYHPPTANYLALGPQDNQDLAYNAYFYLNRIVPKIVIEIDAVPGWEPSRSAVELLVQRLRSVADKPGGIEVRPYGTLPARDTWSLPELRVLEQQKRNYHSSKTQVVMHIMYVNGEYGEGDHRALGVAFSSVGCALFIERIRNNGLQTVPAVDVERADIVHEAGHILSLVNEGYKSPRDHEDPEHPHHSKSVHSVMYYGIDSDVVYTLFHNLNTRPPTDFDADDRADLQDVKNRRLVVG